NRSPLSTDGRPRIRMLSVPGLRTLTCPVDPLTSPCCARIRQESAIFSRRSLAVSAFIPCSSSSVETPAPRRDRVGARAGPIVIPIRRQAQAERSVSTAPACARVRIDGGRRTPTLPWTGARCLDGGDSGNTMDRIDTRRIGGGIMARSRGLLLLAAIFLFLAACASPQTRGAAPPSTGSGAAPAAAPKRIVAAIRGDPPSFARERTNPSGSVSSVPGLDALQELVNVGLVHPDNAETLLPVLAEDVPSVENNLWQIFPD